MKSFALEQRCSSRSRAICPRQRRLRLADRARADHGTVRFQEPRRYARASAPSSRAGQAFDRYRRVGDGPSSGDVDCAEEILGRLARRAYGRPVTETDLKTLLEFYARGSGGGRDFDRGIQLASRAS